MVLLLTLAGILALPLSDLGVGITRRVVNRALQLRHLALAQTVRAKDQVCVRIRGVPVCPRRPFQLVAELLLDPIHDAVLMLRKPGERSFSASKASAARTRE